MCLCPYCALTAIHEGTNLTKPDNPPHHDTLVKSIRQVAATGLV